MVRITIALTLACLLPRLLRADEAADLIILKKAGIQADGVSLLKFLGNAIPHEGGAEIAPLVKKMASEDFFEREEALKKVIGLGPRAAPFLRQALKDADRELARRAEECLTIIEGAPGLDVHGAALRLLGTRKPEGAAAAILNYLPFAPNERLVDEAVSVLVDVAIENGKTSPALIEAMADTFPSRRAAAVEVLARVDFKAHRPALLKRLADPDAVVRMRTGMALALQHEKDAIPVLIALLETLPASQTAAVEGLLQKLADYNGPMGPWTAPKAMRAAWAGWWTVNAAMVDLATLTSVPRLLGKTLLLHAGTGKVQEIDDKGKVEWEIGGLQFPNAAHMLDANRVAILESRLRRLTIRSPKGEILKTITISLPTDLQALPDGNVLATTRFALLEYNRAGTQVSRIAVKGSQAISARKTRAGIVYCLTSTGQVLKLDNTGKELARFPVGAGVLGGSLEITPEGRILVTDSGAGRVVEFDVSGKVQREWKVPGATSAVRLPNGNTLVACGGTEKVIEMNDRGAVVWEHATKGSPVLRASKR